MNTIEIRTKAREEMIEITTLVAEIVAKTGKKNGLCIIFTPHTTAAMTINENADPDVKSDLLMAMGRAVPDSLPYTHGEGNSPAHVKASLAGSSVSVIIEDGKLRLGVWQGVQFCEFDGPRTRQVWVKVIAG